MIETHAEPSPEVVQLWGNTPDQLGPVTHPAVSALSEAGEGGSLLPDYARGQRMLRPGRTMVSTGGVLCPPGACVWEGRKQQDSSSIGKPS